MTPSDPLFERLRGLPGPALDDVAAARTLARAEAAFAVAPRARGGARVRWSLPLALALWGGLYVWGAVRELGRLFPSERRASTLAVALNQGPESNRGPAARSAD